MVKIRIGKLTIIMSTELWLAIAIAVSSLTSGVDTQMTWTPIFIGGASKFFLFYIFSYIFTFGVI